MTRPLTVEAGESTIVVRLSQVPVTKRLLAADRIIRSEKLRDIEALELKMAAAHPRTDPGIRVSLTQAHKVLFG